MSPLARCVGRTIRGHALLGERDRVLVALSGGADSVALTWLLRDLEQSRWQLVGLVHVHHGLRGAEADGDERSAARSRWSSGCRFARIWSTCARAPSGCGLPSRMPPAGQV